MFRREAKSFLCGVAAISLSACSGSDSSEVATASNVNRPQVQLVMPPERDPSELQVLFWDSDTRSARFRDMESWFAGHEIPASDNPRELRPGSRITSETRTAIRTLMEETNAAGVMVLRNGNVAFEDYRLGFGPEQRWTSFSVAKSFTSTLLGAAVADGLIASLDDPVTDYIPGLKGSAYDGVTVEQLATMTSGVAWNEDYTDPNSDVAQMNRFVVEYGADATIIQMKALAREAEPGTKFVYKTGETNLIGLLVENAVGLSLAEYAKEKIVDPAGFEGGMFWMTDPRGGNIGGCCLSLRLSDYARMGQFVLEGGKGVVPDDWFTVAGGEQVGFGNGYGYGYQWWTYPGGNYGAQGIFGQSISLIPSANTVIAVVSNWPTATSSQNRARWGEIAQRISNSQ